MEAFRPSHTLHVYLDSDGKMIMVISYCGITLQLTVGILRKCFRCLDWNLAPELEGSWCLRIARRCQQRCRFEKPIPSIVTI